MWVAALDYAVEVTLVHSSDCGKHWLLVEYLSHKLSMLEWNYDATNRKFVAIVSGLKMWKHCLLGMHFVVRSGHASLQYLHT